MASIFCSPVYQSPSSLLNSSLRSFVRCKSQYFQGCIQNRPFSVHSSLYKQHRPPTPKGPTIRETIRENIYTIPNALTVSRILACPVLGWSILNSNFKLATGLLVYAGLTDLADGYLARRFKMHSVLGTILDPAADKALMTTLTVTLAMKGCLPAPVAVVILGRDILLVLAAFKIRYTSLPPPKTFSRYWDFSIPSAEVRPTEISKINTALQLLLMGATTVGQLVSPEAGFTLLDQQLTVDLALTGLQWIVVTTTIWSGLSYVFSPSAYRVLNAKRLARKKH
ncbi:CDP-alcohol phosphatidyltransferase-domain-containing protein [Armillaria borealis]|uniref:CDP-alcohol phosphatidyltransferase-domain-containing protein n=1 Tax=Armillaria borealis TaxID=47425 RepID=A0AA39MKW2_9AGAR|nr:CDP-alcohol phosphatidyltransferase-domain-containing protein [Armillaria borealis]